MTHALDLELQREELVNGIQLIICAKGMQQVIV